mmetsp:Transcript_38099/g.90513  ORF Transcript_38099/g.90513 Transcript_38099/m.90513 type:complete len:392 (+) Transcript_38099:4157-5332(+)
MQLLKARSCKAPSGGWQPSRASSARSRGPGTGGGIRRSRLSRTARARVSSRTRSSSRSWTGCLTGRSVSCLRTCRRAPSGTLSPLPSARFSLRSRTSCSAPLAIAAHSRPRRGASSQGSSKRPARGSTAAATGFRWRSCTSSRSVYGRCWSCTQCRWRSSSLSTTGCACRATRRSARNALSRSEDGGPTALGSSTPPRGSTSRSAARRAWVPRRCTSCSSPDSAQPPETGLPTSSIRGCARTLIGIRFSSCSGAGATPSLVAGGACSRAAPAPGARSASRRAAWRSSPWRRRRPSARRATRSCSCHSTRWHEWTTPTKATASASCSRCSAARHRTPSAQPPAPLPTARRSMRPSAGRPLGRVGRSRRPLLASPQPRGRSPSASRRARRSST